MKTKTIYHMKCTHTYKKKNTNEKKRKAAVDTTLADRLRCVQRVEKRLLSQREEVRPSAALHYTSVS